MGSSLAPALRMAAGAALLFLLAPVASAQVPDLPNPEDNFGFSLSCRLSHLELNWLGTGQALCEAQDLSADSTNVVTPGTGFGATCHAITFLPPTLSPPEAKGWTMDLPTPLCLFGNERREFEVNIKNTPTVNVQDVQFHLSAVYSAPDGRQLNATTVITAEVNRFDNVVVSLAKISQVADQDQLVTYEVQVSNLGLYPDVFTFSVSADPDIRVVAPPSLFIPAGETRSANVTILTPKSKIIELGRSTTIPIQVSSTMGTFRYTTTGILQIKGSYFNSFWIPIVLLGLTSAAVVGRNVRERAQLRRLEKGLPRRVQPTPRQAVLLAEMKRRDPAGWKAQLARMEAVYAARRERYKEERKVIRAKDREEAKAARAEYKAAVVRRKAEREEERRREAEARKAANAQAKLDKKAAKAQAKLDKKAAKAQAKIDKRAAKAEAKERKRLEKELEKKRKILDKQKAKVAKIEARRAKAEAKAARKAAKDQGPENP